MNRLEPTIVQKAIQSVEGFEKVYKTMREQTVMRGQSQSTFHNYIRRIATISLHFDQLPEKISEDEINEYLTALAMCPKSPSRSSFKHAVYGLRYYFRHIGLNKRAIALPSLKKEQKLPVILNQTELRTLFAAPALLKHRIMLTLIYSAGLRGSEAINLKLSDIDFERKTIHIRQSKYKKDRIVPLSDYIAFGLKKYITLEHPETFLLNGKESDKRYSIKGLSWIMRQGIAKAKITKEVNLHSLRHSYATHLLEQGVSIVKIKDLLGHAEITTTMVYLHVAQCPDTPVHSPLDRLYKGPWNGQATK
jgi:site-specific recombinase XerD